MALSDEGFHETETPVGSLAFFHFGTELGGGGQKKITLYKANDDDAYKDDEEFDSRRSS